MGKALRLESFSFPLATLRIFVCPGLERCHCLKMLGLTGNFNLQRAEICICDWNDDHFVNHQEKTRKLLWSRETDIPVIADKLSLNIFYGRNRWISTNRFLPNIYWKLKINSQFCSIWIYRSSEKCKNMAFEQHMVLPNMGVFCASAAEETIRGCDFVVPWSLLLGYFLPVKAICNKYGLSESQ